jgi:crotonobetainyl-CoA:carnitine CoA-transferase CaiB-like acyl-CoA transferase
MPLSGVYPCADGYIHVSATGATHWEAFVSWLSKEGVESDLGDERWAVPEARTSPEGLAHIDEIAEAFFATRTRDELCVEGQNRGLWMMPVNTAEDVVRDPQLKVQNFMVQVEHPELGRVLEYPGGPYKLEKTPWRISRRAPLIGEHNVEIYGKELGYSAEELNLLKQARVI